MSQQGPCGNGIDLGDPRDVNTATMATATHKLFLMTIRRSSGAHAFLYFGYFSSHDSFGNLDSTFGLANLTFSLTNLTPSLTIYLGHKAQADISILI